MTELVLAESSLSAAPTLVDQGCYHCGEPLPRDAQWATVIEGALRAMCCAGCQAVAETILANGLGAFYRERVAPAPAPAAMTPGIRAMLAALDDPEFEATYSQVSVANEEEATRSATLTLGGLSCAACAWLLERRLGQIPGVVECAVNYATRHARLTWQPARIRFSTLVAAARDLGFDAVPLATGTRQAQITVEYRTELRRFGVAALCGMQVMMIAAGLYFDADSDAQSFRATLNWLCAGFSVPVVTYCALPFYRGAWRALRARAVTMNVSITLGIGLGFGGSLVALGQGVGEVYFDSVTMFVSLLLLSRLVELAAWRRSVGYLEDLSRIEPCLVERVRDTPAGFEVETVSASAVIVDDRVRIAAGATLPCDGTVLAGESTVDERLLTGEATPARKRVGDCVISGSTNMESPLEIRVTAIGTDTVFARIGGLAREAMARKPKLLSQAQAAATIFIWIVLGLALITAGYHGLWRGGPWIAPTLVVLVISCPCALALAVPTAMSMALASLLAQGVLVIQPDALSRFARVRRIVFDKTGTLTVGRVSLLAIEIYDSSLARDQALALASALEAGSAHPIASAMQEAVTGALPLMTKRVQTIGYGVCREYAGQRYLLGSVAYLERMGVVTGTVDADPAGALKVTYLGNNERVLARFLLADETRADAGTTVAYFRERGIVPTILSGDHPRAVAALARTLAVEDARASCDPAAKLAYLEVLMHDGTGVAAIGDGINDTPMLARADVGITLAAASAYAKLNADIVLLKPGLSGLVTTHRMALRLDHVARQNLWWALAYNGLALPFALAGVVAPWVAALLMAMSSLAVVANASRVYRSAH